MSGAADYIAQNHKEFLKFLKVRYPLYHLSNVFFRDLHYGVMHYLDLNKQSRGYSEAEKVAREVTTYLEDQQIFSRIDDNTWLLQYPEFKLVSKKPAPPARPAAAAKPAAPAAPKPAAAVPASKPADVSPKSATAHGDAGTAQQATGSADSSDAGTAKT